MTRSSEDGPAEYVVLGAGVEPRLTARPDTSALSWAEILRDALLGLDPLETVHDCRIVIEAVEIVDGDSLRVDFLSTFHRRHRTKVRGVAAYQTGFEPALSPIHAARLLCLEMSEPGD